MRLALFRLPDGDRLLLALHHLVVDGLSWRILFEDIQTLYRQHAEGVALALPRKTDSFKSWAELLAVYANSAEFLAERDYWAAIEATPVPLIERDGDGDRSYVADEQRLSFDLSVEETDLLLTRVNKAFNTEINDILLAALGLAAANCFGHLRVAVAVEGHGREEILPDADVSRTVGWFTTIYPVVLDLSDAGDLSKLIKGVKENLRGVRHKGIGHGLLKHLTRPEHKAGVRFNLRPQFTFNYHGQFDADLTDLEAFIAFESPGKLRSPRAERMEEFGVSCSIEAKRLRASISFSREQHRPAKVEQLCRHYRTALLDLIAHCSNRATSELTPSDLTYKGMSIEALDHLFNLDH
jgi:non-ribosomal peptide synthase protein (TIGR01720 family)